MRLQLFITLSFAASFSIDAEPSEGPFRSCNFSNGTDRDARCGKYLNLEPIAVQDTWFQKMLCYWPDPTVPDKASVPSVRGVLIFFHGCRMHGNQHNSAKRHQSTWCTF